MAAKTRFTPGCDHCVRARPGTANMRARFEIQVQRGATRSLTGFFQRQHLGVLLLFVGVCAATDDLATFGDQHGADTRIRRSQRHALPGKLQRLLHELLVASCLS